MAASNPERQPSALVRVGLVIAILVAIMGLAYAVVGRESLDRLGTGGQFQSLLPKVGDPAPDFIVIDLLGNPVRLSDFKGVPVWLNFWGSWCPPCRAEMPDIQEAYDVLQPKGVVLLAVSLREPTADAALFAARNNVTFLVLSDPDEIGSSAYPIANFPTHLFIDSDGIVRKIVLAPMNADEAIDYGTALAAGTL